MIKQLSAADLRALSIFQTICQCGGFVAAEESLNLNQSTISNHIAGFESRIGFALCSRGRKGFQLTERGKLVLDMYQKLAVNIDSFCNDINSLQDESSGVLRVGTLDQLMTESCFSITHLIREFTKQAPNVTLHFVQDAQFNLHTALVQEQLDLIISVAVTNSKFVKPIQLYTELNYLYCGKGHPLYEKHPDEINVHDIEKANWVTNGFPPGIYSIQPFPGVKSSVITTNIEAIAMTIMAGNHIGYLPEHYAENYEKQSLLKKLRPNEFCEEVELSIVSKIGRRQTEAMRKFLMICKEHAPKGTGG